MSSSTSSSNNEEIPSDYYELLGVSKDASAAEIKRAWRVLARKWHPDKNLGNEEYAKKWFQKIGEAYEILSDATKRARYDQKGEHPKSFVYDDNFNDIVIKVFHNALISLANRQWTSKDAYTVFFGALAGLLVAYAHPGSRKSILHAILCVITGAVAPFVLQGVMEEVDKLSAPQRKLLVDMVTTWFQEQFKKK